MSWRKSVNAHIEQMTRAFSDCIAEDCGENRGVGRDADFILLHSKPAVFPWKPW
jgi:hypothetical protein